MTVLFYLAVKGFIFPFRNFKIYGHLFDPTGCFLIICFEAALVL